MQNTALDNPRRTDLTPSFLWEIRRPIPYWLSNFMILIGAGVPIVTWVLMSFGVAETSFLPTPWGTLEAGMELIERGVLWEDLFASSSRVVWGFLMAAAIGIPIGILSGAFKSMEALFSPLIGTIRYMPVAAFIPLIIIWAGVGELSKAIIIFLGIVFYNALMISDAVRYVPEELINSAYTLGGKRRDILSKVIAPAVLPNIIDTLRVNVSGAWNYLVIAELIGASSGLGYRIVKAQRFLDTDQIFFCILLIGLIGILIDFFFRVLSRVLTPWAETASAR